ncbi:hypothetical protein F5884DRAFT_758789 [Xylogone sp. PMI_703]|nr:hypothetical protein F5884DRAFT_758789 [Xylogone sp. PMI_703]
MVNSIHMGWWVLSKYYGESDKSPIYATASLLHPEKRRKYIDRHWEKDWGEPAIAAARQYWTKFKDRPITLTPASELSERQRELTTYERLKQSMSVLDGSDNEDEFERFIIAPPKPMMTKTPLEWWCREEQKLEYPHLHQMAIEVLSRWRDVTEEMQLIRSSAN